MYGQEATRFGDNCPGGQADLSSANLATLTFGTYLTKLREERAMHIDAFRKALGVRWQTAQAWETKGVAPEQPTMQEIVKILRLSKAEREQLTSLWLAIPNRRKTGGGQPEPADVDESAPAAEGPARALETLIMKAVVPGTHTLHDATTVFRAVVEAAPLLDVFVVPEGAVRAWLDAAVALRGHRLKITPAAILFGVSAALGGPHK